MRMLDVEMKDGSLTVEAPLDEVRGCVLLRVHLNIMGDTKRPLFWNCAFIACGMNTKDERYFHDCHFYEKLPDVRR